MTKFEISAKLESAGARLGFFNGQARVVLVESLLKIQNGFDLLADQLKNPLFAEEDLNKVKKGRLNYKRSKESTRGTQQTTC